MNPINPLAPRNRERRIARAREARRAVGHQRHYRCGCCGYERQSWLELASCPSCGEGLERVANLRTVLA